MRQTGLYNNGFVKNGPIVGRVKPCPLLSRPDPQTSNVTPVKRKMMNKQGYLHAKLTNSHTKIPMNAMPEMHSNGIRFFKITLRLPTFLFVLRFDTAMVSRILEVSHKSSVQHQFLRCFLGCCAKRFYCRLVFWPLSPLPCYVEDDVQG